MTRLLKPLAIMLSLVLALGGAASAVTVRVMDRDLQGLLGYGRSAGSSLTLQVASGTKGPVLVLLMSDDETTVLGSYTGVLQGSQIVLDGGAGTLSKVLASRGVTVTVTPVDSVNSRSFSLPGLKPKTDTTGDKEKKDNRGKSDDKDDKGKDDKSRP
ncbi:hypothetical protein [Deinococcus pimensis]|uniref:hypothetical protein n=1 Tax=Deinococcus pimensis TaxID=309888 RepID=UPI0004B58380|nr:hypothetical protein [Deinococcus pimensis]